MMNRKLKIGLFVIIFLAVFNLIFFFTIYRGPSAEQLKKTALPTEKPLHPMMIEALRQEKLPPVTLTIEQNLGNKGKFTSYIVSYFSDGLKLYALLNIPASPKPAGGYPVIVVNHGYIPPKSYSTVKSYILVTSFYAAAGFLVLKPDYRGHDRSESGENSPMNRLNYRQDVLSLLAGIPSLKEANPDQVFMMGHSMGGDVTLAVLEASGTIKAASLWAAVSVAFPESTLYFTRKHWDNTADEALARYKDYFSENDFQKLSPINYTNYISCPLIIHHGTKDESVPYQWSLDLCKVLDQNKISYQFYSYPGDDHNFAKGNFYRVLQRDADFFRKAMNDAAGRAVKR